MPTYYTLEFSKYVKEAGKFYTKTGDVCVRDLELSSPAVQEAFHEFNKAFRAFMVLVRDEAYGKE